MRNLHAERHKMVSQHLQQRGISERRVIQAMLEVPRERFVSAAVQDFAYADMPLRIEEGQTISQPYVVALMVEKCELQTHDRVLEVGTGSGYAAAVLSQLAQHVYTIERHRCLYQSALERFQELGYTNITCRLGDGSLGWPEEAPFEAIVVSAAAPSVSPSLLEQIAVGGRMLIPVGPEGGTQRLLRVRRSTRHDYEQEDLGRVQFVPLIREIH